MTLTDLAAHEHPLQFPPDCAKRAVVPFTFTATLGPSSTAPALPNTAEEREPCALPNRLLAGPWPGTPLRASVPLPRRTALHTPPRPRRAPAYRRARAETNRMDEGVDDGARGDAESGSDEEEEGRVPPRCCAYVSITAAEGLAGWSFEELRVECYAQSLVARGTKPPPVVQPSLAIPPAFVPRIVPRR